MSDLLYNSDIFNILNKSLNNEHLGLEDCRELIKSDDIYSLGLVGNTLRNRLFGNTVTFVNNIILNYTNVCITYCKFCAFYRPPKHKESYTLSLNEIINRISVSIENFNTTQILFQGGHNPNLGLEYFEEVFTTIKKKFPHVSIHGLSASEIDMISKVERSSTKEVLSRLKDAGLDSLPGAGAEILDDQVKSIISPLKISSSTWLRIMEEAHNCGLKSSATMMYGTVETDEQIAQHIIKILKLQEKTNGFMAFIPWGFEPNNTQLYSDGIIRYPSGGFNLLKMISISRIMLFGLIDHIQSSWLTNGIGMAQLAIYHGADDFGGTLIGEEVVSATGARSTELTSNKIIDSIKQIDFSAAERDNYYKIIKTY
ncbi:MAG: dehypoxanthine futalosine cyclase [Nitrososphaeraceae archaeon]|nr:dehypoxanthine futalosine cyclase [Nitrososphaeraceae archaeon]